MPIVFFWRSEYVGKSEFLTARGRRLRLRLLPAAAAAAGWPGGGPFACGIRAGWLGAVLGRGGSSGGSGEGAVGSSSAGGSSGGVDAAWPWLWKPRLSTLLMLSLAAAVVALLVADCIVLLVSPECRPVR